jgi:hypothetical protein
MLKAELPESPEHYVLLIFGWTGIIQVSLHNAIQEDAIATWQIPQKSLPTVLQSANALINELSAFVLN